MDFSRINEARHKWRRMDTVGTGAGNLRRLDDADARSDTASAYEELMYALRADMREEMLRMRSDLLESFSAVKAECKGLQRKDLSDAVAEIKADLHAAVKSSARTSRPESQQLNSILREIHDVKATLDTTALPAKTVVDHDVLRSEICKLDRRHLANSSGGPAESVCCMLSTQICMLSTQLEKLREDVLGRLETPAREGPAATGPERSTQICMLSTQLEKLREEVLGRLDAPARDGPTANGSTEICMLSAQFEKLREEVLGWLDAPAREGPAASREPLHGDMEQHPPGEVPIQSKVVEVLDVVARHQCELLEAIERVEVRPQVDVTPVVDMISRIDLKPHSAGELTKMLDAFENVSVRLTSLEMFLQSTKRAP